MGGRLWTGLSGLSVCALTKLPVLMDKENRGALVSPQRGLSWMPVQVMFSQRYMDEIHVHCHTGAGVVYQRDTPVLIWTDASLMSWKLQI